MDKTIFSYTLFFNSSAIHLTESFTARDGFKGFKVKGPKDIEDFFEKYFKKPANQDFVLFGYKPENLLADVKKCFRFVEAAGGIVRNKEGQSLFIKRLGIWDLPKGKMKAGENRKECALREVEEETAVRDLILQEEISPTHHIYLRNGKKYLKATYWFLMKTTSKSPLIPQNAEDIELAVWLDKSQSIEAINQSYRSLKDTFLDVIKG